MPHVDGDGPGDAGAAPALRRVAELRIELGTPIEIGGSPNGRRRIIPIVGGEAIGELAGTILPVGADFQVIRPDGITELEARYVIATADGPVYVENRGLRSASPEDVERLTAGLPVDPSRVYFRTTPRFEVADGPLDWLNRTVFVGGGERRPDSVRLLVWAVG